MLQKWRKRFKERKAEASILRRAGITLVETMVSVMLLMILLTMVVGIVSPAFKVFIRMQKLQFAQMILDNVVEEIQDNVREATDYVKIYESDGGDGGAATAGLAGNDGVADGLTLEYVNTDGYVVVVSTGGCQETYLYHGSTMDSDPFDAVDAGRLLYRYYRKADTGTTGSVEANSVSDALGNAENRYYYFTRINGSDIDIPIARAATTAFGSGYYMGNYLKVEFSFPEGVADGEEVSRLEATASLYDDVEMADDDIVASETFVIDFRYSVVREDNMTASYDADGIMGLSKSN